MNSFPIIDFNKNISTEHWITIDDTVMGGKSSGNFHINSDGKGVFSGIISLENNGGFSSVRYRAKTINTRGFSKIVLTLKGDGKRYQFRVKQNSDEKHSYVSYFETSGTWETIEISLKDLQPKFRGKHLDLPNFSGKTIDELGFLIGNKNAESFELIIQTIVLQ